jgi:hypothetical protein
MTAPDDWDRMGRYMQDMRAATQQFWSMWTPPPQGDRLPAVLLLFTFRDDEPPTHVPPDPVRIHVPGHRGGHLPERARIAVQGPTEDGADELRRCLIARLDDGLAYSIEPFAVGPLTPGVYTGMVYLGDPARPLADLRVVVEGRPG